MDLRGALIVLPTQPTTGNNSGIEFPTAVDWSLSSGQQVHFLDTGLGHGVWSIVSFSSQSGKSKAVSVLW